ncbi:hypothetical protein QYS49_09465 [Marivirga salinae]|uniref:Uncharacterized protein n=1 Tax=Marivirga salinarum TaxID=3059078 RepID=A0AA49JH07_9BACT|nr:hypothetical protein [Marivirga sp. BDSF4-3]WKK77375.2 hypothetical protein QYS49_09465 [Marivirga sp. BDSF4-3]
MLKYLIPFLLILILFSCIEDDSISYRNCWSLAESGEEIQVYYPCGDDRLGPSWFRSTYAFYSNNKCEYLVLHPADAHYMEDGIYEHNPELSILTIKTSEGDLIVKFKILSISEREMKVKILEDNYF